jgi:hypothetical protein
MLRAALGRLEASQCPVGQHFSRQLVSLWGIPEA